MWHLLCFLEEIMRIIDEEQVLLSTRMPHQSRGRNGTRKQQHSLSSTSSPPFFRSNHPMNYLVLSLAGHLKTSINYRQAYRWPCGDQV